jgi:cell fate (sporulation/competence/biofilm development) regulator YmcA (YheA/YmcA/DUF963 family)
MKKNYCQKIAMLSRELEDYKETKFFMKDEDRLQKILQIKAKFDELHKTEKTVIAVPFFSVN